MGLYEREECQTLATAIHIFTIIQRYAPSLRQSTNRGECVACKRATPATHHESMLKPHTLLQIYSSASAEAEAAESALEAFCNAVSTGYRQLRYETSTMDANTYRLDCSSEVVKLWALGEHNEDLRLMARLVALDNRCGHACTSQCTVSAHPKQVVTHSSLIRGPFP